MKKRKVLYFCLLLALLLTFTACGLMQDVYKVETDDGVFTVDAVGGTITSGGEVYGYEIEGRKYTLTYPDGETFW